MPFSDDIGMPLVDRPAAWDQQQQKPERYCRLTAARDRMC